MTNPIIHRVRLAGTDTGVTFIINWWPFEDFMNRKPHAGSILGVHTDHKNNVINVSLVTHNIYKFKVIECYLELSKSIGKIFKIYSKFL